MATLRSADAALFVRLHVALMVYANGKLGLVRGLDSPADYPSSSLENRLKLRDGLHANPQLIDSFVAENPAALTPEELALVAMWKKSVPGTFYILRHLKRYTVFLDDKEPAKAYGVLGITQEIADLVVRDAPIMVKAVLLPWREQVVYDGLMSFRSVTFGPGIRRNLNERYQKIKATTGIIEALHAGAQARTARVRPKKQCPTVEELLAALGRIEQELAGLKTPETPLRRSALGVVGAAAELARSVVGDQVDADEVVRAGRRLNRAHNRLYKALDW